MIGDILLFEAVISDVIDELIVEFTHGPFTHAEVQVSDAESIGDASEAGLIKHAIPTGRKLTVVPMRGDIERGLAWANRQVLTKHEYGFKDIINNVLMFLHIPFRIPAESGEWDCSHFATLYMMEIGNAGSLAADPSVVSPNDIAREFNVLPTKSKFIKAYK